MQKKCFKCNELKPIGEFYVHPQMLDGHLNKCKLCTKKDAKEKYSDNKKLDGYIEKERKRGRIKYHRLYAHLPKNYSAKGNKLFRIKFPEKIKAIRVIGEKNKIEGLERHHWSYNEPHYCDVIHLTQKEHKKAHRFIMYDQEFFMYRRIDNMALLDTKEKHFNYIKYCIDNHEN